MTMIAWSIQHLDHNIVSHCVINIILGTLSSKIPFTCDCSNEQVNLIEIELISTLVNVRYHTSHLFSCNSGYIPRSVSLRRRITCCIKYRAPEGIHEKKYTAFY